VVLRDVQNLNNLEAAEILEISVSALKARLHRGRVLLRKHLEGYLRS
jgi:RNA polymerase sigma-70 factor (ECF subfamily)